MVGPETQASISPTSVVSYKLRKDGPADVDTFRLSHSVNMDPSADTEVLHQCWAPHAADNLLQACRCLLASLLYVL